MEGGEDVGEREAKRKRGRDEEEEEEVLGNEERKIKQVL